MDKITYKFFFILKFCMNKFDEFNDVIVGNKFEQKVMEDYNQQ